MKTQEIIKALRTTTSRSKRALLDEAADRLEQLQKEKEALVADLKKLEETGEMCIFCSHCCAGGRPIYQQSDDYLEYCTPCERLTAISSGGECRRKRLTPVCWRNSHEK